MHLVEISEPLRACSRQRWRARPDQPAVTWHRDIAEVPEGPAIVIANEFLDALPIRQLVVRRRCMARARRGPRRGGRADVRARRRGSIHRPASPASRSPAPSSSCARGEEHLLAQLAARTQPFVALFIDYGPATAAVGDTLQAVRRHDYVDPLAEPGTADLTAHVLFAALADKARAAGPGRRRPHHPGASFSAGSASPSARRG